MECLDDVAASSDRKVTQESAREMMRTVSAQAFTHHSVVFEPDRRLMHVAFPADGEPVKVITLNVTELLKKAEEDAKTSKGR